MSDLVGNPEDRFSHNEAQLITADLSLLSLLHEAGLSWSDVVSHDFAAEKIAAYCIYI